MTVLATSSNRFSNVVKYEFEPSLALCREAVVVNDAAATIKVGACLGRYIASPVGTAGAIVGTGNGTMGTITLTSNKDMVLGTYVVKIIKTVTNAGDFVLLDPNGKVVGKGEVATAFAQAGFAFTLADGSTDFVAGDYIPIVVTGTYKYKLVEATATNGTEVVRAIYIADVTGNSYDTTLVLNTDQTVLALVRGPAIVSKSALSFGASVDAAGELAAAYDQIEALGIRVATTA